MLNKNDLNEIKEIMNKATPCDWLYGCPENVSTPEQMLNYISSIINKNVEKDEFVPNLWTNFVINDDKSVFTAITGCGPNSENNAKFISMARSIIHILIEEIEELKELIKLSFDEGWNKSSIAHLKNIKKHLSAHDTYNLLREDNWNDSESKKLINL